MTEPGEAQIPAKLTIRVGSLLGDRKLVLVNRPAESARHVLLKALVYALYLPAYPNLAVELPIGDRYRPDLVALGAVRPVAPSWYACCGCSRKPISSSPSRLRT
jgi:hypothetical protein